MPRFSSPFDSADLFYRDYVPANHPPAFKPISTTQGLAGGKPTLVFIHGWPMSSLMYQQLMLPLCETHRYRCIATDRRGFGFSDWRGGADNREDIDYNVFADDTIYLLEKLKLESFILIGASMGCGETILAFQRSQYVRERCKGFVWMGPSLPFPLSTPENPQAPPRELWDAILDGIRQDRAGFIHASIPGVFGAAAGVKLEEKTIEKYERIVDMADAQAIERCTQIITSFDFTSQLSQLGKDSDVPIMVLHGDSDQGMPYEASTKLIENLIPRTQAKIYEVAGHGLYLTHAQQVIKDLLAFTENVEA